MAQKDLNEINHEVVLANYSYFKALLDKGYFLCYKYFS